MACNMERFLSIPRRRMALDTLLQHHPDAFDTLINLLGSSQFLSDTLVMQPTAIAMLGLPLRHTPTRGTS